MIKNIIFDFGDIFIDLDKNATAQHMIPYGFTQLTPALTTLFNAYEKGLLTTEDFIAKTNAHFPKASPEVLVNAWNAIILFFPENRLRFIEALAKEGTYRLFLLSNTNALHIKKVKEHMTEERFNRFKACFEQFYLSHEIQHRKPDTEIYNFVLTQNKLLPEETLFIDDTQENTAAAKKLGIRVWHLQVGEEDVVQLNSKLKQC